MGKQVAVPALLLAVFLVFGAATALARSVETPALSSKWTTTDPPINLSHIELGEINHRGEAVGYHHRPNGLDPPGARMVRIVQPPDASGVYRAKVALCDPATGAWIEKKAPSTFYPDAMAPDDVVEAVLTAFRRVEAGSNGHFVGSSGRGFAIEGWYQNGRINAAYPLRSP